MIELLALPPTGARWLRRSPQLHPRFASFSTVNGLFFFWGGGGIRASVCVCVCLCARAHAYV